MTKVAIYRFIDGPIVGDWGIQLFPTPIDNTCVPSQLPARPRLNSGAAPEYKDDRDLLI
jgi:hypothetical protein